MLSFDERDRESVLRDLESQDEEIRRLAVERMGALPPEQAVPLLVDCLGDPGWRVRKASVERLVAWPDDGSIASALIAALADGDNPGRRNAAVEALVQIGAPMVTHLVEAMTVLDPDVRKFAVDSLAGIGDTRAISALIGRLEDDDPNVRAAAADALGAIGGSDAIRALKDTAASPAQEGLVRFSALHALAALEVPTRACELASVLDDPVLRPAGIGLLGYMDDDADAVRILLKALTAGPRAGREAAVRAVLRLAARLDGEPLTALEDVVRGVARGAPELVPEVVERLEAADLSTKLALVQFLGLVRDPRAAVPVLKAARDEAIEPVALATVASMGDVGEDAIDAAWSDLDVDARRHACQALRGSRGSRGAARLVAALDDRDPEIRAAAASSLGVRGQAEALSALLHRLEQASLGEDLDGDDERVAVSDALVAIAGPESDADVVDRAVSGLQGLLAGADDPVRLSVASVLGRIGRSEHADIVSLLLKDASPGVRCAAVDALARLEPEAAVEPLHLAIGDESPNVRIAAARALAEATTRDVFDDLRRLAEDEDARVRATAVAAIGRRFAGSGDPPRRAAALAVLAASCDDEALVALAAIEAISEVGGESASYLVPLLRRAEPEVVREAVRCLGSHAEPPSLEALVPLVSHPDWSVRAEAITVLAARGMAKAVPAILRRLETEQDEFVRSVTLRALERLEA